MSVVLHLGKFPFFAILSSKGTKDDWDFQISYLVTNPHGTDVMNFGEVRRAQLAKIHSPDILADAPAIFSKLSRSVQTLKREWGAESNGKLPHLFIPSKTPILLPEFPVEDLPLNRTAVLVSDFEVKDLPLDRTLMMMMMMTVLQKNFSTWSY